MVEFWLHSLCHTGNMKVIKRKPSETKVELGPNADATSITTQSTTPNIQCTSNVKCPCCGFPLADVLLTTKQVCAYLQLSEGALDQIIYRGELASKPVGKRRRRIALPELHKFLQPKGGR